MRVLFYLLLFFTTLCIGQDYIQEDKFEEVLSEDIVIIEFYADWNKDNKIDLKEFKDVKSYVVNVEDCPNLTKEYKILSVPTLIIFNNKKVVEKYEADLTFQLCIKAAKKKVEELVLKKFM
ncbi:MAG: hypothetical protein Unbinned1524contig1000_29 [Prokaryotic dsDNA virus sp.]|nr:MAG: hypothetical protein Unbinned1524contig1000_29 [Prokaryotic dsDNA virus sp.]|tara:strand:- start:4841 stop:5203 length:363 start_codon:yes stop_codon:yes gene_type:complete